MAFSPIQILITARDQASAVFGSLQTKALAVSAAIAGAFGIALFKSAVDSASEFEAKLSEVSAVSGATKDEMVLLREAAEAAGSSTRFTAAESADALGNLARAGLSVQQSIAALPATLSLAQAGQIGLNESSTIVTQTLAGFGLQAESAGRIADVLAMGANASNTSVKGLGDALSYAAPTAVSMGLSLETTVALLGKFADGGIDASRAGTAFNSILSQFGDPASKFRQELAALGITTNNFEDALVQLAGAGDRGGKAIRAVGLEAAPAFQSLLNQGVPALQALKAKLDESGGSAATFAAQVENNLTGATKGLSSAWDALKIALGTPVLPVLKDAVTDLANSLRNAVSDGTVGKFGDAIAKGFQSAVTWAKAFLAEVDFAAMAQTLRDAADRAGAAFDVIREKAVNAGDIVRLTWGAMSAGVNTVLAGVFGLGSAFAEVASMVQNGLALIFEGIAKISFGVVSDSYKLAAEEVRLSAEATGAAADALAEKAREALAGMEKGAQMARDGFAGLTSEIPATEAAAARSKAVFDALAESVGGAANQDKLNAFKALEDGTQKVGDKATQAAGKVQELGKASQQVGTDAKQTAQEIEAAFTRMGINTQSSLQAAAENSRKDFETIKASGQATADGLQTAFKKMADAAIASGDAGAIAFVKSQAAANGYRLAVDAAGAALEKLPEKAKTFADSVSKAFEDAGIKTQAQLDTLATKAAERFELIKGSGQASADGIKQAWRQMAEASIAANGGVASEVLKAEAAMYGLQITVDDTGRAIVGNMKNAKDSVDGFTSAVNDAIKTAQQLEALQKGEGLRGENYLRERNKRVGSKEADEEERKRRNVDKDGFTLGKDGNRLAMGSEQATLTGVKNFLEQAGLTAEKAKEVALEFSDGKGAIPYFSNPGQLKYGGRNSTISQALLMAAERTTFAPTPPNAPLPPGASGSRTVVVELRNSSGGIERVSTDEAGAAALVRSLQTASLAAGR